MKQYINRNALLEELRDELNNDVNIYHSHTAKEIRDAQYEFAIERIAEASAADVRENIHAKWIWKDFNHDGFHILCCSECYNTEGTRKDAKFCSECGAVMDLE